MKHQPQRPGYASRYPTRIDMFWLTSIPTVVVAAGVLCSLHTSRVSARLFAVFLTIGLVAFNVAVALILANYWIDAYPWTKPKMLLGLIGFTFGLAMLIRVFRPLKFRRLSNHWKILRAYTTILLAAGFVGGLALGWPAWTRYYVIESDRWGDVATAIVLTEITSLYSLMLALVITIGSSNSDAACNSTAVE